MREDEFGTGEVAVHYFFSWQHLVSVAEGALLLWLYQHLGGRIRNWVDRRIRHQIVLECRCSCDMYMRVTDSSHDIAWAADFVEQVAREHNGPDHGLKWLSAR